MNTDDVPAALHNLHDCAHITVNLTSFEGTRTLAVWLDHTILLLRVDNPQELELRLFP